MPWGIEVGVVDLTGGFKDVGRSILDVYQAP